jgi:hypothetical protein
MSFKRASRNTARVTMGMMRKSPRLIDAFLLNGRTPEVFAHTTISAFYKSNCV